MSGDIETLKSSCLPCWKISQNILAHLLGIIQNNVQSTKSKCPDLSIYLSLCLRCTETTCIMEIKIFKPSFFFTGAVVGGTSYVNLNKEIFDF